MLWKAYCIGIVWRCYKYLTLRQQSHNNTIPFILSGEGLEPVIEPDYSTLLHEREAGFGGALKLTPPPSYQDIMNDQPPPYPVDNEIHDLQSSNYVEVTMANSELNQQNTAAAAAVVLHAGLQESKNGETEADK